MVVGSLSVYDPETSWESYSEVLEQYFEANDVPADKQRAILLASIGPRGYELLKKLCVPSLPKEKTFDQLCQVMQAHKNPKPSIIVSRYKFNSRKQLPGEPIASYVAELKKMASHCEFGDNLWELIRDRLVCGVSSVATQKKLLSEDDLTYKAAVKIAVSDETADWGVLER